MVILVLVVIGAAVYFALPLLQGLPQGSILNPGGVSTNNNIITIEDYSVSNAKMHPGEETAITFTIRNNGDHPVSLLPDGNGNSQPAPLSVNFYDLGSMVYRSMLCDQITDRSPSPPPCQFIVKPFETKRVILTLQSPDVASLTTFKISYSVKYSYMGGRVAVVPIVDGVTRTRPLGQFSESKSSYSPDTSVPSYGPVQLSYKPPVGGTTKIGNQLVNEYWGVNGQPFRLELDLGQASTVDGAQPVRLTRVDLSVLSNNLRSTSDMSNNFCPIGNNVNTMLSRSDHTSIPDISTKPVSLNCQFTPDIGSTPESNAQISTTFAYDYTILRSETLTVEPFEQKR